MIPRSSNNCLNLLEDLGYTPVWVLPSKQPYFSQGNVPKSARGLNLWAKIMRSLNNTEHYAGAVPGTVLDPGSGVIRMKEPVHNVDTWPPPQRPEPHFQAGALWSVFSEPPGTR